MESPKRSALWKTSWFTERHNEKRGILGAEIQITIELNSRDVERPKARVTYLTFPA